MKTLSLKAYGEIWLVDFEFRSPPGEPPEVVCLVAREYHTKQQVRLVASEMAALEEPPYGLGDDCLFVAYCASAEFSCHLALGWALPTQVLDLFAEFRVATNTTEGHPPAYLLDALKHFGINHSTDSVEKELMCDLIMTGEPYSDKDQKQILDYCESNVVALELLLPRLMDEGNWPQALLRGRYMKAVTQIERNGTPVEAGLLSQTLESWPDIRSHLIALVDTDFGVYEGTTFKKAAFSHYLMKEGIAWPQLPSGGLDLKEGTFADMAKIHPQIGPLHSLRSSLSKLRTAAPTIGTDERNRFSLVPFRSRTGRNQPSSREALFGYSAWMRGFMKATPGFALVYIDWSQQEFGIAAALSGDQAMMTAYASGDPYLEFARQAGSVPPEATKQSHPDERALFKECVLAVQYGMGAASLAKRIDQPESKAAHLLSLHRRTYGRFWEWSEGVLDYALLEGKLKTTFGWPIQIGAKPNKRSIQNFLMQANGAEMLRLACIFATEAEIKVCAPVHDAVLIEASLDSLEATITAMQEHMAEASRIVLNGFELRSDAECFPYPQRYADPRGQTMWDTVMTLVNREAA